MDTNSAPIFLGEFTITDEEELKLLNSLKYKPDIIEEKVYEFFDPDETYHESFLNYIV